MTARRLHQAPPVLRVHLSQHAWLANVQTGKQGIKGGDRKRFREGVARISDSLDLDVTLLPTYPNGNRWDYIIGLSAGTSTRVLAAEVHQATDGEIRNVIAKKAWTAAHVRAANLPVSAWHWIATDSGVSMRRGGREEKLLVNAGIAFPVMGLDL